MKLKCKKMSLIIFLFLSFYFIQYECKEFASNNLSPRVVKGEAIPDDEMKYLASIFLEKIDNDQPDVHQLSIT